MAETIKKKRKNEPDGFDRFNRVSNKANVLLNLMFLLMALVCIIPVLLLLPSLCPQRLPLRITDTILFRRSYPLKDIPIWQHRAR